MPTIDELKKQKPMMSDCKSADEFRRLSGPWEDHIAPVIVQLERIADTQPQPSSFEDSEDFEEAFGFWMGRQGRVISLHLSNALMRWQSLSRCDDN